MSIPIKPSCFTFYASFHINRSKEFILIYDFYGDFNCVLNGKFKDPGRKVKESDLLNRGTLILIKEEEL